MPTGFALVGCGMISEFHAMAIADIRGAKLVACVDRRPESADAFAAKHDITSYHDLDSMLADPAVDVVAICTPSGAHMEPAVAAAKAGKHVVVEKPLEITLKRCDKIIDACDANGVKLCTILPNRFYGANIAMKEAIDAGRFGKLTLGDTYVKWWRTQEYYDSGGWRGTWALDGGGAYMNQAIHNVDLLYWFMGDVAEVTAITDTLAHERIEVEDTGVAAVRFANGAIGTLEATTSAFPGLLRKTEIHGTEGSAVVEQEELLMWEFLKKDRKDASIRKKFGKTSATSGGAADPKAISYEGHKAQLQDLIKAIETGSTPKVDGREGRKSVEIILAIYQASWTGKKVTLPLKRDPKRPS
ncbi:Gfo/Idh/MocA family protein [Calycomorphotria hydatis]|uniref:1,5-anhydro-D-fructose reductase n=1 Tax=Calycomorphotria hydatis TaxID=2528027 RepID=A0A517T5U1_9PLAN|nr:Gfo/Idh/MocA family oxidoreductase [Calycomorphotria hydatis]QDT63733.1 1,5-anhydro-D-fructose reductase [Calycomorphotria hydatis]